LESARFSLLKLNGPEFNADDKIASIQESLLKKKLKEKQSPQKTCQNSETVERRKGYVEKISGTISKRLFHFKRPGRNSANEYLEKMSLLICTYLEK
jgi:hypothetical protein